MHRALLRFLPDDPRCRRGGPTRPAGSARSPASRCRNASKNATCPIMLQLAWRVAVLGGIAFVLFGIVFFRLWYLQVLTGEEARRAASDNRVPHGAASRRRAATSATRTASSSYAPRMPWSCRSCRASCPRACATRR